MQNTEHDIIRWNFTSRYRDRGIIHLPIVDLPGRNGMDLVLKAKYRSRDAKLFNEVTRSGAVTNSYGATVVAHFDVFDRNGYWLKQGGLVFTINETIVSEWQNGEEKWVFNGYLAYESGGSLFTANNIYNTTGEQSKTINGRYMLGAGWAFNLPFLDVDGDSIFVELPDGLTYKADFNEGNGLEKYELKDLLFERNTSFSYGGETAAYRLYFKNGDEFFFSSDGFLIGKRDKYRNTIRYNYEEMSGIKVLTKIEDSVGRVVDISYNDSATIISSGPKRITLLKRLVPGQTNKYYLAGFTDPAGREIHYQYNFENAYFDSVGKTGSMEYFKVKERYDQDGERNTNRLTYQYFNEPDGYPVFKDASKLPDNYRYRSSVKDSKGLDTRYVFDGQHLPIFKQIADKRVLAEISTRYHSEYRLPVEEMELSFNSAGDTMERISFFEYDSRGNVLVENHPTIPSEFTSSERKFFYEYDARYNLLLSKKYKQDADTTVETKYTLTPDGREAASMESYANGILMSQESYRYDDFGNFTSTTAKKTATENITVNLEYGPEYGHAYLTAQSTVVKDADGKESTVNIRYSYDFATGDKTGQTDGNGNVTTIKYDLLDRPVERINPDGTIKKNSYDDTRR